MMRKPWCMRADDVPRPVPGPPPRLPHHVPVTSTPPNSPTLAKLPAPLSTAVLLHIPHFYSSLSVIILLDAKSSPHS